MLVHTVPTRLVLVKNPAAAVSTPRASLLRKSQAGHQRAQYVSAKTTGDRALAGRCREVQEAAPASTKARRERMNSQSAGADPRRYSQATSPRSHWIARSCVVSGTGGMGGTYSFKRLTLRRPGNPYRANPTCVSAARSKCGKESKSCCGSGFFTRSAAASCRRVTAPYINALTPCLQRERESLGRALPRSTGGSARVYQGSA